MLWMTQHLILLSVLLRANQYGMRGVRVIGSTSAEGTFIVCIVIDLNLIIRHVRYVRSRRVHFAERCCKLRPWVVERLQGARSGDAARGSSRDAVGRGHGEEELGCY